MTEPVPPERGQPLPGAPRRAPAIPAAAALIAASTGDPRPRHLDYAVALRHALPEQLRGTADAPERARSILLALVALTDAAAREPQLQRIAQQYGQRTSEEVRAILAGSDSLPALMRMPAVLQLFPALRALPVAERMVLIRLLQDLARLDGTLSVFEYCSRKWWCAASRHSSGRARHTVAPRSMRAWRNSARSSRCSPARVAATRYWRVAPTKLAWHHCCPSIGPPTRSSKTGCRYSTRHSIDCAACIRWPSNCWWKDWCAPSRTTNILAPEEAELLRAICSVLECPLPPVLPELADG